MNIVDFLRDNWSFISTGVLAVLSIIIMIIKRRPKKFEELNQVISDVIAKIPGFIIDAETTGDYNGQDKKSFVVSWCFQFIEKALGRDLSGSEELYCYKAISYFIELVLESPTKKGGYGREQVE